MSENQKSFFVSREDFDSLMADLNRMAETRNVSLSEMVLKMMFVIDHVMDEMGLEIIGADKVIEH